MGVFRMPSLGADMESGTLVEWLVAPGAEVSRGDVIAVVETQKGAIEIEVFETGRVARLLAEPGQTLPVGAPLAEIGTADGAAAAPQPAPETPPPAPECPPPAPPPAGVAPASPAARVAAGKAGLDLAAVKGSGPGGAVLLADLEAAAKPPPAAPRRFDPAGMRAAIAAAMTRSNREIPHFYLFHAIDLQAASDRLAAVNAGRPPETRLVMGLLLIRAAARAARKVPGLNGVWTAEGFAPSESVDMGVAISLRGGGLVAPALRAADEGGLDELMARMTDMVARARSGRLRGSEITAPTMTVSSLGDIGVDAMLGVVFPPQAALVCFGTPAMRAAVVDGAVVPRLTVEAALCADHRVADGRLGARFLAALDRELQTTEAS